MTIVGTTSCYCLGVATAALIDKQLTSDPQSLVLALGPQLVAAAAFVIAEIAFSNEWLPRLLLVSALVAVSIVYIVVEEFAPVLVGVRDAFFLPLVLGSLLSACWAIAEAWGHSRPPD
jgi:hypothetical protein